MNRINYIIKIETGDDIKFIDYNDDFEKFEKELPKLTEKTLINDRYKYDGKVSINYFINIDDKYSFKETLKLKKKYRMIDIIERNRKYKNINY